eukprot:gnl/MRDRNA2_/MRDRNA2_114312_c0_seq1.p1 gnl/MRDRNA2_/MRDRNA2_114312_c0~~gnl/MRDRNA2_/MRDRNA2_114312_c0_seq1.p1  ORF type:complete len:183 (-),score=37.22 gnl/MRDRNA2_/MRDRNA2_114312_c0_seq1:34-582(-)
MSDMSITVSGDFGYVMIAAGVISVQAVFMGGGIMALRKQFFASPEFKDALEKSGMLDEHKKAFPEQPTGPLLGYPDMGHGRYAALLPYDQWVTFNNAQRAHHNMLEALPSVLTVLVLAGLYTPRTAAGLGFVYFVARIMYAQGYKGKKGAKGREAGAILGALTMLGLFGLTVYGGLKISRVF